MNSTKEYIALAKNEKVQELRPEIEIGDWLFWNNHIELNTLKIKTPFKSDFIRSHVVFIPNGDQLDDEIIKIFENRKNYGVYDFQSYGDEYGKRKYIAEGLSVRTRACDNPLIAKISLLIKLLEVQ